MKIFIRYSSFKSKNNLIPIGLPPRYASKINIHWDASCRPDPDFDPQFPSTGLCRSPIVQNFISKNINKNIIVYYFYTFRSNGTDYIAISSKFKIQHISSTHGNAFSWLTLQGISNNNIPLHIVVDSQGVFRNCTNTTHSQTTPPDDTYSNRSNYKLVHLSWLCNKTNHPIVITKNGFINALLKRNATLTNPKIKFNSLKQLQNSVVVIQ